MKGQRNDHKQCGFVTITIAVILLVGVSLLTVFTSKVVLTDQTITANIVREKQAFESAEAGRQFIIGCLSRVGGTSDLVNCPNATLSADSDGDGLPDEITLTAIPADFQGISPTISLTYPDPADTYLLQIESVGKSDDGTAVRKVQEQRRVVPPVGGPPSHPLISKNSVGLTGTGTITNTETNATIWAGGAVDLSGSTETYISNGTHVSPVSNNQCILDKNAGNTQIVSKGGNGATADTIGVDIIDSDIALTAVTGDELFENYFNATKEQMQQLAPFDSVSDLDGATGTTIYLDGDSTINGGVSGCTVTGYNNSDCASAGGEVIPVIIIVEGDLTIVGNPDIYGIIYVTGNIFGAGTMNVYGSVIVEDGSGGGGTLDITYCSAFTSGDAFAPITSTVPGTWKDW